MSSVLLLTAILGSAPVAVVSLATPSRWDAPLRPPSSRGGGDPNENDARRWGGPSATRSSRRPGTTRPPLTANDLYQTYYGSSVPPCPRETETRDDEYYDRDQQRFRDGGNGPRPPPTNPRDRRRDGPTSADRINYHDQQRFSDRGNSPRPPPPNNSAREDRRGGGPSSSHYSDERDQRRRFDNDGGNDRPRARPRARPPHPSDARRGGGSPSDRSRFNHRGNRSPYSGEKFHDSHDATVEALWLRTNAERRRANLNGLNLNADLSRAAQRHADDMALNDYVSHNGMNGSTLGDRVRICSPNYRYKELSENLYVLSPYNSPTEAVSGWMDSVRHRENLLRPSFGDVGIGYAAINGRHYYVQVFGRTLEEAAGPRRPDVPEQSTPGTVLDLTNRVRSRENLPPVVMNGALCHAAQIHADRMARTGGMISGNDLLAESGDILGFCRTAVNCASCSGPYNDPSSAVEGWLENCSESTRNLLERDFTQAGVGYARRGDEHYYVQLLGSLSQECLF